MILHVRRGVRGIRLVKIIEKAVLLDPRQGFSEREYTIEIRKDPLTGWWCRINVERARRERQVPEEEVKKTIEELAEETRQTCVFCRTNFEEKTPKFSKMPRERYCYGKVVLMPNLFPFGETHALAILDPDTHVRDLDEIDQELVQDLLHVCIDYFRDVTRLKPRHRFHYINMNLFFPAGSSIIHPHAQIFTSIKPTPLHAAMIARAKRYYDKWLAKIYDDYILTEIQSERYVTRVGHVHVITYFAPVSNFHTLIISEQHGNLLELSDSDIRDMAHAIARVCQILRREFSQHSMNFAILSTCHEKYVKYSRVMVHIVCRKEPSKYYVNDIGFIELLHREPVVTTYPEDVGLRMRRVF